MQTFLCRYGADAGELTDNVLASLGNIAAVWSSTSALAAQTIAIQVAGELCDEVARTESSDSVASRRIASNKAIAAKVTASPSKKNDTAMKATQCNDAGGCSKGATGEKSKQSPKKKNSTCCCC